MTNLWNISTAVKGAQMFICVRHTRVLEGKVTAN